MAGLGDSVSPLQAKPQMGDKEVRELHALHCLTLLSRVPTPGATHLVELTGFLLKTEKNKCNMNRQSKHGGHGLPNTHLPGAGQPTVPLTCPVRRTGLQCPRDHPPLPGPVFERFWVPQGKTQNPETSVSCFHPTQHTTCQQARSHTKKPTRRSPPSVQGPASGCSVGGFFGQRTLVPSSS